MNFADLHELLRLELVRRIDTGTLTGTRLAQQTGFQQAHISNFLNSKRALSLEGLDRVLAAQKLTVEQVLPLDLAALAAYPGQTNDPSESVPLVSPSVAVEQPEIPPSAILESITLSTPRLLENDAPARKQWHRFVAVRVDAQQAAAMAPLLPEGAIVVISRRTAPTNPPPTPYASAPPSSFASSTSTKTISSSVPTPVPSPSISSRTCRQLPTDLMVGRICFVLSDL